MPDEARIAMTLSTATEKSKRVAYKLTPGQWRVLLLWLVRYDMLSHDWNRCWNDGLLRWNVGGKYVVDGNRAKGRARTNRSLEKLGLLTVPPPGEEWTARGLTGAGCELALSASDERIRLLPEYARFVFRREYRGEVAGA
jgi:hypothetical protein